MDTNEKLDVVLTMLQAIEAQLIERDEAVDEKFGELAEAISNLSLPGTGYTTFDGDL